MRTGVDRDGPVSQAQGDAALFPEGRGAQGQGGRVTFADEVFLGQRRPLVGEVRFVAGQQDRAGMAALAQGDRELGAGLPRAKYQDVSVMVHVRNAASCQYTIPMRIAKPLLLVATPLGVVIGLEEAWRLAGGLVVLLATLIGLFGIAILGVVRVVRREAREGRAKVEQGP